MNKRRLLKLADMLEADAKNKKGIQFDLGTVGRPSDGMLFKNRNVTIDCGTTACAMGLAAISGEFERAGLTHSTDGFHINTKFNGRIVNYDRAAMRLFDISEPEANFLFTPAWYPSGENHRRGAKGERYVAKRIRDFVAGKVGP